MSSQVLLVDDEQNVLSALRRGLRGRFDLETAEGGPAALEMIRQRGPYAVIVTDMRMPEIDGLHVLSSIRKSHPDTMRVMLTGNADQKTAIDAVNEGAIFRFLNKPCPADVLGDTIEAALRQHHVQAAERSLLTRTLTGTIGLVTEVLSVVNPTAYGRSNRLRQLAHQLCEKLQVEDAWQIEVAAMLSQVGCLAVPESLLSKQMSGASLNGSEQQILQSQSALGSKLVSKIPRLEPVAQMISLSSQHPASSHEPDESQEFASVHERNKVLEGAHILALITQFDIFCQHMSMSQAVRKLRENIDHDTELVDALSDIVLGGMQQLSVHVKELREGMLLDEHVLTLSGDILIAKGHELTPSLIQRIRTFECNAAGVRQPIRVSGRS